ncbi:uncharacterized protein PAC_07927 [Phialocephala subalpina]|uniref:Uncharacterized protein n=1 Tax=Phialocephala subalpina TaxID=576137 RepID=A0A1L7WZ40_9HELO|nr:uncharacterized protein PAC_07927 [Phialocephala subalpina]
MSPQRNILSNIRHPSNDLSQRPTSKDSSSSSTATLNNNLTSRSFSDKRELRKARIATWLASPVDPQPQYRHSTSSASMIAHTNDIITYLEGFDRTKEKRG